MRLKKSAIENKFLIERLFDELVTARHKIPSRQLLLLPNAHEHFSHVVGGYNFMTDTISRPSERGKKRRAEDSDETGSETDQPELDEKGEKKQRPKKEKIPRPHRRRRLWMPLWEGDRANLAEYLAKAVNTPVDEIETLLLQHKDSMEKLPSFRCAKWKTLGCSFKCQVTFLEVSATVSSLGVHKHEGKITAPEAISDVGSKSSTPLVAGNSVNEPGGDDSNSKSAPTRDLDVPISSPSLLPLPSTEEDNSAALKVLAAWKPPQPSSEEEGSEGDEAMGNDTTDEGHEMESSKAENSANHTNQQVDRPAPVEKAERVDEGDSVAPRVDDHTMFSGFEPGFLETEETTTYHAIGTIGHDGKVNENDEDGEGDEGENEV